ncbi:MAG: HAMP domain-containing sensor histidine kinase [Filifactor alocis]|nr:HAMP domain-containing sensor histidine kinase [Filifactor alocis]
MPKKIQLRLKSILFLAPTLVIILIMSILLLTFHVAVDRYTVSRVSKNMEEEFSFYDEVHSGKIPTAPEEMQGNEFIIPIHSILLDNDKNILFPYEEMEFNKEYLTAVNIRDYMVDKNPVFSEDKIVKVTEGSKTYMVKSKAYHGTFDGFFILDSKTSSSKNHVLLVYADITPMQEFIDLLDKVLIVLTLIFGVLGIGVFFLLARSIDSSLNNLKKYIISIGKRETVDMLEIEKYREFEDVIGTVNEMAMMIDESERVQRTFFQNASHELRTPLMSIQGYAEGLQAGIFKDSDKALSIIVDESDKMSKLISQMLLLSNTQGYELNKKTVNLTQILYGYIDSIRPMAIKNDLTATVDAKQNIYLLADETLLERAFLNILSNATRYARSKISLCISAQNSHARVDISDDGPGIAPTDLPHIFERFYKGEKGNFGIGLAITKDIIEKHGGTITAESSEQGTTFTIIFPRV